MSEKISVLVTGAGAFIGHHLTRYLVSRGYWVRGVDLREPEYEASEAQEFELLDLTKWENCLQATESIDETSWLTYSRVWPGKRLTSATI